MHALCGVAPGGVAAAAGAEVAAGTGTEQHRRAASGFPDAALLA